MRKCLSCGTTYQPVQHDVFYPHVCPPLSAVELAAAVADGRVVLPTGETLEDAFLRRIYHRANARDENVTGPPDKDGKPAPLVSEGAGYIDVPDVASVVVVAPARVAPAPPTGGV